VSAHVSVPVYRRSVRQRYRLVAHKCPSCGELLFPPKGACKRCGHLGDFEEVTLSGKGTVHSFTVLSSAGAPPEFQDFARTHPRYVVAIVQLDEGPMVIGQLVDAHLSTPAIGGRVEAVFRRIYVEEDVIRYGYKFRLVEG